MSLTAASLTGLYTDPNSPEFTCHVSGIRIADPEVRFDLLDYQGQVLATHTTPLTDLDFASAATAWGGTRGGRHFR
jgi:hypothetical protein